jgi:hypothetical protein
MAPIVSMQTASFEVERFGWTSSDRLELVGRWFGVRGRRFLRPVLDVEVDGARRRLLALLEHKPWPATDGHEWTAAFPWEGEPAGFNKAELSVGPDVAVELPAAAPPARGSGTAGRRGEGRGPNAGRREREVLEAELATARAEIERLRHELDRVRAAHRDEIGELSATLDAERGRIRELGASLRSVRAQAARSEAERDRAVGERDSALSERAQAAQTRDQGERALTALERERAAAHNAREQAQRERNTWMSRAEAAMVQRDAAVQRALRAERDARAAREPSVRV